MSWSGSGTATKTDTDVYVSLTATPQVGYAEEESKAQIAAVQVAIKALLGEDAYPLGNYSVSGAGHANVADPELSKGWSSDYASFSVSHQRT